MKKTLGLLMSTLICLLSFSTVFAATFTDVDGHWAEAAIERWAEEKVINGYEDNTFKPENNVTRAEFVAMIMRIVNTTKVADLAVYNDVEADAWYYDVLAKAVAMELVEGYSNNTLKPTANITRQEAIVILNRVLELDASKEATAENFSDAKDIADWAEEDVLAFVEREYVKGYDDGSVRPTELITRAESAQLLNNVIGLVVREDGEYDLADVKNVVIVLDKEAELKNDEDVEKIVIIDEEVEEEKEDKEEEKETTSGGGGGAGAASTSVEITLTTNESSYTVKRSGKVKDGKKLTVIVDDKTILDKVKVSEDTFEANMNSVIEVLDTALVIETLDAKYNEVEALRDWGMNTVLAMDDDAQTAALLAAVVGDGEKASIADVFAAVVDGGYMTADEVRALALTTLTETFDYESGIAALNEI